jgi:uncharacterized cupredoxin-like copper-binding protein
MHWSSSVRSLFSLAALAALVLTASSCGGTQDVVATGRVINVNERDFHINAAEHLVSPGVVVFRVSNRGPDRHELIMVRAPAGDLPLRSDGMTVSEEALERATVGVLEPGQPGSVRELRVRLRPGRYEFFCNMSGHFKGGMHTAIVVR